MLSAEFIDVDKDLFSTRLCCYETKALFIIPFGYCADFWFHFFIKTASLSSAKRLSSRAKPNLHVTSIAAKLSLSVLILKTLIPFKPSILKE
jgi:hypothetical protein